jgi:cullin 1
MGILLQYNNGDTYTFEELRDVTNLALEAIIPALSILVKAKILLLSNGPKVGDSGSKYSLNTDFKR